MARRICRDRLVMCDVLEMLERDVGDMFLTAQKSLESDHTPPNKPLHLPTVGFCRLAGVCRCKLW
jgi:hypothetical protein